LKRTAIQKRAWQRNLKRGSIGPKVIAYKGPGETKGVGDESSNFAKALETQTGRKTSPQKKKGGGGKRYYGSALLLGPYGGVKRAVKK